jgi:pimeloyl-ACP methyl ester carboxylesterase
MSKDAMSKDIPASPASAQLSPVTADATLLPLPAAPFRDAVMSIPVGATEPRPVVVALHGNYDRPEWQCEVWRAVTKGFPFVVCPRGIPRSDAPRELDRWTYGKGSEVEREIDAALASLASRFGDHVARGPVVYAGFSLGAIIGVGVVSRDPARFAHAVLVEGGHSQWTRERARAYATGGGKRVLFACGQRACKAETTVPGKLLEQAGVDVHLVYGDEQAHTYDGKVAEAIGRELAWLIEGDLRWAALQGQAPAP